MNWVDIVVIAIFLLFIIIGCVKGFMFSILSLFGGTVNLFLSLWLCNPMKQLLNTIFNMEASLTASFRQSLTNMSPNFDVNLSTFTSQAELSSHVNQTISNSELSSFSKGILGSTVHITTDNVAGKTITLNDIISKSFATFLTIVISFIIVFVLLYLILWLLSRLSKKARENNGIKLIDRILGFVFGFIKGSLIIVLIFGILSLFNENGLLIDLFGQIKESAIGSWIYKNVDYFVHTYIDFKELAKSLIDAL